GRIDSSCDLLGYCATAPARNKNEPKLGRQGARPGFLIYLAAMHIPAEPKVILRHCDAYDANRIRTIIEDGLAELDLRPQGRTLIKPNIVAAGPLFPHAYTRPEFAEGVIGALKARDDGGMTELAVGERCGITVPSRAAFDLSGYDAMIARQANV